MRRSVDAIDGRQLLTAVVAMTPSGVIGRDGDMPWRLRSDLRRFKKLTMGGVLIMGRRTYDSIGRPLPGRRTIVITRNPDWSAEGVESADSPAAAIWRWRAKRRHLSWAGPRFTGSCCPIASNST